jgi:deazaflavin-dependent oxidoreductase (nitroreductase family)
MGWLLGGRFLMLTHTGRKSGLPRQVVIEVVRHDKKSDTYYVASGWGEKSDWFRNVMKNPEVVIRSGGRTMDMRAERISPDEAEDEMLDYYRRHPATLRELARAMGYRTDGTEADVRALGRLVPMVAFTPR